MWNQLGCEAPFSQTTSPLTGSAPGAQRFAKRDPQRAVRRDTPHALRWRHAARGVLGVGGFSVRWATWRPVRPEVRPARAAGSMRLRSMRWASTRVRRLAGGRPRRIGSRRLAGARPAAGCRGMRRLGLRRVAPRRIAELRRSVLVAGGLVAGGPGAGGPGAGRTARLGAAGRSGAAGEVGGRRRSGRHRHGRRVIRL